MYYSLTNILLLSFLSFPWFGKSQHQFIHPGTIIPPEYIPVLSDFKSSDDISKKAYDKLIKEASKFMKENSQAKYEVRVFGNPSKYDNAPYEVRRLAEQNKAEAAKGLYAGHEQFTGDAERSYKLAIAYLLTKNEAYAKKAISLLSSWADTCKKFGPQDQNGPLEAGWGLASYARTAELLKYTYPGWASANVEAKFIRFVDSLLMPNLKFFDKNGKIDGFAAKGNWGTTIAEARLQYAIFREDDTEFQFCLKNYKHLFDLIFPTSTGKQQETTRDIMHAQFGLAGFAGMSGLFRNQGIDTYSVRDNLLGKSFEYHASILNGEVPPDMAGKAIKINKFVAANWEMAHYHFSKHKGLAMPHTTKVLEKNRPEIYEKSWGLGTLIYYSCSKIKPLQHLMNGTSIYALEDQSPGSSSQSQPQSQQSSYSEPPSDDSYSQPHSTTTGQFPFVNFGPIQSAINSFNPFANKPGALNSIVNGLNPFPVTNNHGNNAASNEAVQSHLFSESSDSFLTSTKADSVPNKKKKCISKHFY